MASQVPHGRGGRQDRRKEATKRRIVTAADTLFLDQGYDATSIEEIAAAADVAVRTIYLHFESKAAIMLSYFDEWVDAFIDEVLARPHTEPVAETVRAALANMEAAGWADRVERSDQRPHPLVEHLGSGSRDVAGHVMQRWMQVLPQLVGENPTLESHARAMAIVGTWIGGMFVAAEKVQGVALPDSLHGPSPAVAIAEEMTSGRLAAAPGEA